MSAQQPEALRLADALEDDLSDYEGLTLPRSCQDIADEAAGELRRLHSVHDDLLEALKELLDREWQDDEGDFTLERARKKARAAIAKAIG